MAVVNLPTGLENIPQDMGMLGRALTQILFPGTLKDLETEALIRERPEIGERMAMAVRANGPDALKAAGVSPRLSAQLAEMFPAKPEELIQRELAQDPNFIRSSTEAARQAPQVALAQGRRTIAEGELAEEQIGAVRRLSIPELQARALAGQLTVDEQTTTAQLEFLLPSKRAWAESLGIDVSTTQGQFQMDQIGEYREWIKTVSPHLRGVAIAAGVNPSLATHILAHEQMSAEADLQGLRLAADTGDLELGIIEQAKLARDLRGEVTSAIDRARAANEEGNRAERDAALADLENIAQWQRQLVQSGILPQMNIISGEQQRTLWGMGSKINFTVEEPQVVEQFTHYLDTGELTLDEAQGTVAFMFLSPAQQKEIVQHAMAKGAAGETNSPNRTGRFSHPNSGQADGGTAPRAEREAERAIERQAIAQEIAKLHAIPSAMRTQEQIKELQALVDRLRFGSVRDFFQGTGPTGQKSVTGGR